jgi:protein YIPF5/7
MNPYLLSSAAPTDAFSGAMDTNATFSGPMDTGASAAAAAKPSTFIPQLSHNNAFGFSSSTSSASSILVTSQPYNPADFEDEPPLLEELGINIEHIVAKMRSVVLPFSRFKGTISDATVIQDADLAGPIALGLLLGGELMLSGKLQFGYIYGFGLFGCISMTLVLNFMSPHDAISVWTVTSILGYSLLPVNLLAAVKLLVVNLGNFQLFGQFLGFLTVLWCTVASTRLMEQGCDMRDQRYLIAYPIGLLYTAFVMITIF